MPKKSKPKKLSTRLKRIKPLSPRLTQMMQQATQLRHAGRYREAEFLYSQILSERPNHPDVNHDMGLLAHHAGQSELSITFLQKAIDATPNDAKILNNFGAILEAQQKYEEAAKLYEKASLLKPRNLIYLYNAGSALQKIRRYEEAIEYYNKSLNLDPRQVKCLSNLGTTYQDLCLIDEAHNYFEKALSLESSNPMVLSNFLCNLNYLSDISPEKTLSLHQKKAAHFYKRNTPFQKTHPTNKPIKVGYISTDLRNHSVAFFFEALLAAHNHSEFEITCYCNNFIQDDTTSRLKALSDSWVNIYNLNDDQVIDRISQDKIDILVDLGGHTLNNRMNVFSSRAAKVQITWLGYPHSTGIPNMDYRLIDNITDPVDQADNLSSERLIRLPKGFLCYRGNDSLPEPQSPPFTKNQYFTFGSFNNLAKVNEDVITSWSRILLRVPNSKLLIKSKHLLIDSVRNRYLKLFEDAGVAIERIDLRTEIKDQDEHMKLYNEVDLALDPFPYNGTTTTCEALWMGVPTVTFTGDRHASRVGASIMSHAGLSEFVATDIDSYIELASQVATYPDKLTHLRKNLRNQMKKSDLCNTKQFAELIEEQYRKLALD